MKSASISVSWFTDDVHKCVNNLSEHQAYEVLQAVKKHHNSEIGINWDVIRITALSLFPHATGKI